MIRTHTIHVNKNGSHSLRHIESGEVMHSSIGPLEEALALYVEQSALCQALSSESLVLWDCGLGAGTNAFAAIAAVLGAQAEAPSNHRLQVVSFENDLSGLELALENEKILPYIAQFREPANHVLDRWRKLGPDESLRETISISSNVTWTVFDGDFRTALERAPAPDLIYYDFYSPKVCPDLWTKEVFSLVHSRSNPKCRLFTYSSATRVHVALLDSGFYVGRGQSTGAKNHTTAAAMRMEDLKSPLGPSFLSRLERSHIYSLEERAVLRARLSLHPQWRQSIT